MNLTDTLNQLRQERATLDKAIQTLEQLASNGSKPRGKRGISADGRRRIALAQKKRWAKFHKGK